MPVGNLSREVLFSERITEIERILLENDLESARERAEETKEEFQEYRRYTQGHMLDYFLAQSMLREEAEKKHPNISKVDQIIEIYTLSLELKEGNADAHIQLSWAYMVKHKLIKTEEESRAIREKIIFHSNRAKQLNPNYKSEANKNIRVVFRYGGNG